MTITVAHGHTAALVVAAAVLTAVAGFAALVLVTQRRRLTGGIAVLGVAALAGWACAGVASAADNDVRTACAAAPSPRSTAATTKPPANPNPAASTGRSTPTAPPKAPAPASKKAQAKPSVPASNSPIDHPLALTAALFMVTLGCCGLGMGGSIGTRQLSLAGILVALALAWLCVDVTFEGAVVVNVVHSRVRCAQPVQSHGVVAADLAALVPLIGAGALMAQALSPWRWGQSSAAVVRQS